MTVRPGGCQIPELRPRFRSIIGMGVRDRMIEGIPKGPREGSPCPRRRTGACRCRACAKQNAYSNAGGCNAPNRPRPSTLAFDHVFADTAVDCLILYKICQCPASADKCEEDQQCATAAARCMEPPLARKKPPHDTPGPRHVNTRPRPAQAGLPTASAVIRRNAGEVAATVRPGSTAAMKSGVRP